MYMKREGKTGEDANNRYTVLEDIEEENKRTSIKGYEPGNN
jgi:hypothetical protein